MFVHLNCFKCKIKSCNHNKITYTYWKFDTLKHSTLKFSLSGFKVHYTYTTEHIRSLISKLFCVWKCSLFQLQTHSNRQFPFETYELYLYSREKFQIGISWMTLSHARFLKFTLRWYFFFQNLTMLNWYYTGYI